MTIRSAWEEGQSHHGVDQMDLDHFSPGLLFSFLLATAYGLGFHLVFGGPVRKLLLYLASGWMGFAIGQWVGTALNFELLNIGPIHAFSASLGAWLALVLTHWLGKERERQSDPGSE